MDNNIFKVLKEVINDENIVEFEMKDISDIDAGDNYLGVISSIVIEGEKKYEQKKVALHLVIKSATKSVKVRELAPIHQVYLREVHSYRKLLPALRAIQRKYDLPAKNEFKFIKCYKTIDVEFEELIVLENLKVDGFVMRNRGEPLNLEHIKLIMENLGYLHSLSFALKIDKPKIYEEIANNIKNDFPYSKAYKLLINTSADMALRYISNSEHRKWFKSYKDDMCNIAFLSMEEEMSAPYNVFCHGDCWQNNVLFKYKDGNPVDLRLIDWQMVKHCSPIIDIGHLIFSSSDGNLRRDHYEELLDIYYESLTGNLKRMNCDPEEYYPRAVFRQQLKNILPYGLIFSIVSLFFLMREKNEIIDMEAMAETVAASGELDLKLKNQTSAKKLTERLDSLINDIINLIRT